MPDLVERYADQILGVLSCYDRVIVRGRLAEIDCAKGMALYLRAHGVRLFDFPQWAKPFRDEIRDNTERLAQEHGIEIRFVRGNERKETIVAEILEQRGGSPGLVAILSALELCESFEPRYDKKTAGSREASPSNANKTGRTFLRPDRAKCTHYYFYFLDEELGLCYLRVSTWCPFDVQAYFNGHSVLASKLRKAGIAYEMYENAFTSIADWQAAQALADASDTRVLHEKLDQYARMFCPVIDSLGLRYQWNLAQVEYSTDLVFRSQADLSPVYDALVRTAVHTVKPENIRTVLGRTRPLHPHTKQEIGTDFQTRVQGTRVSHRMGPTSIKMYDKGGRILRIETTTYNPSWFRHYRTVAHRDGTTSHEMAPLKKSLYSLHDLRQLALAAHAATSLSSPASTTPPSPSTPWLISARRSKTRDVPTAASTSSRTKTCTCSRSLFAGRTPSRASEMLTSASTCPTSPRARSRGCSNAYGPTTSSRRSGTRTSTTSPSSDVPPSSRA